MIAPIFFSLVAVALLIYGMVIYIQRYRKKNNRNDDEILSPIFLVVKKEGSMCFGVFDSEEKAKRYMAQSDGVKIVYLGENEIKSILSIGYFKNKQ